MKIFSDAIITNMRKINLLLTEELPTFIAAEMGEVTTGSMHYIEAAPENALFINPSQVKTKDYIEGRFG